MLHINMNNKINTMRQINMHNYKSNSIPQNICLKLNLIVFIGMSLAEKQDAWQQTIRERCCDANGINY